MDRSLADRVGRECECGNELARSNTAAGSESILSCYALLTTTLAHRLLNRPLPQMGPRGCANSSLKASSMHSTLAHFVRDGSQSIVLSATTDRKRRLPFSHAGMCQNT